MFSKHVANTAKRSACFLLKKQAKCVGNHTLNFCAITALTPKRSLEKKTLPRAHSNTVSYTQRTNLCGELTSNDIGQEVRLCGWLQYQRMGGVFLIIRDSTGLVQIVLSEEMISEINVDKMTYESVIEVHGNVRPRIEGQENKKMKTGDIEIEAKQIKILSRCKESIPLEMREFNQSKEALRMEYRYLDIRSHLMQSNLRTRSKMVMKMREFLCNNHGFVDVETPTLFRRTPGGAKEFVVPTRQRGQFYTLPQSPQQFKQLLMVGGIDRYFQIAKCYRDEGARPDRQPEFTQVDLEMSFTTQGEIQDLIEHLLQYSWPDGEITLPFPEISYTEAMTNYGTDKPDIRYDMKLVNVSDCFSSSGIKSFEDVLQKDGGQIIALKIPQGTKYLSNKEIKDVMKNCDILGTNELQVIKINEQNDWKCPFQKYLNNETKEKVASLLNIETGDMVFLASGVQFNPHESLGRIRIMVADLLESKGNSLKDDSNFSFLWITDFPLFLPKEEEVGLESAHHPFTAPHPDDVHILKTNPEKVRSQHYDLVLNGYEIGGGSIRIHDADLQRYVLTDILKEDTSELEHLLEALSYGCPPHGGIALGLDRLLAVICRTSSIRDVIAFPKSGEGKDLMSKAPAPVSESDLDLYHIQIKQS